MEIHVGIRSSLRKFSGTEWIIMLSWSAIVGEMPW